MAMPQTWPRQGEWTVEEVLALPEDGKRHEVIDGVHFVTSAPRLSHQEAVGLLSRRLTPFVLERGIGWPLGLPGDIRLGPQALVQPDVFVAPLVAGRRPRDWADITHLLLAVEVLSASTAVRDREVKRRLYQQHADEYWIVDLDARRVERWRPGDTRPEVLDAVLEWRPAGADEPLVLDLPAFFREVLDR